MALSTGSMVVKDPEAAQWPKGIDWTAYLAAIAEDETVALSTWAITAGPDDDLSIESSSIVTGNLKTQLRLSGGTLGAKYRVTNTIVTNSGVTEERSFTVKMEHQ